MNDDMPAGLPEKLETAADVRQVCEAAGVHFDCDDAYCPVCADQPQVQSGDHYRGWLQSVEVLVGCGAVATVHLGWGAPLLWHAIAAGRSGS